MYFIELEMKQGIELNLLAYPTVAQHSSDALIPQHQETPPLRYHCQAVSWVIANANAGDQDINCA
jgi:hypothetical protein